MSSKEYNTIVKTCWHTYAAPFAHELRPRRIVLLGKSLERAITMEELATQAAAMGATPLPTLSHPSDIKLAGKLVVNRVRVLPMHAHAHTVLTPTSQASSTRRSSAHCERTRTATIERQSGVG